MAWMLGRRWEEPDLSLLPEFLGAQEDLNVSSRRQLRRDITEYRITSGRGKVEGTVYVYNPGMQRLGLSDEAEVLPFSLNDLVGERGSRLLAELSLHKVEGGKDYIPDIRPDKTRTALELHEASGAGATIQGMECFGAPESFRKHAVKKRGQGWVELRIPGEDRTHYNVRKYDFYALVDIYERFLQRGEVPPAPCPLALVNLPGGTARELYGKERPRRFSPNYMIVEYLDGRRVGRYGRPATEGRFISEEYVKRVAQETGIHELDLYEGMAEAFMKVTAVAHDAGYYLGAGAHLGNVLLCRDGVARSSGGYGHASSRIRLGLKMTEGMYKDVDSMARELYTFELMSPPHVKLHFDAYHRSPRVMKEAHDVIQQRKEYLRLADQVLRRTDKRRDEL